MEKRKMKTLGWILAALIAAGGLWGTYHLTLSPRGEMGGALGETMEEAGNETVRTEKHCVLEQTFRFTRCGHMVTRRLLLPDSQVGMDFETLQKQYAPWTVESFSPSQVKLSRDENMFCPMHQVLMTDEMGNICVFQNLYGDGLAFIRKLDVRQENFSDEEKRAIFEGIGFDSPEEMTEWISLHRHRAS